MTERDIASCKAIIASERARGSVWDFAKRPLIVGLLLAAVGWAWFVIVSPRSGVSPGSTISQSAALWMLASAIVATAGTITLGYGVVRLILASLMASRTRDLAEQSLAVIESDLATGTVEIVTMSANACWPVTGLPALAWLVRCDDGSLLFIDSADFQPARPVLFASVEITLLPISRRVVSAAMSGPAVAPGVPVSARDLPEFARGYRAMRPDHFSAPVAAVIGS